MPQAVLNTYNATAGGADVSRVLLGCSWGGSIAEMADHAHLTLGVHPKRATELGAVLANGGRVSVRANGATVFDGIDFAVDEYEQPGMAAYEVVGFDPTTYLMRSEADLVQTVGGSAIALLDAIINVAGGFPLGRVDLPAMTLPPKTFLVEKIADMLTYLLQVCSYATGDTYIARWNGGLEILRLGGGEVVADLTTRNATHVRAHQDIEDTITAVKLSGAFALSATTHPANPLNLDAHGIFQGPTTPPASPPPITKGADFLDQFGRLQKVIKTSDFPTAEAANAAAHEYLRVYGDPHRIATFVAFDVPRLRKGDKVAAHRLGPCDGEYTVTQIEHDAATQLMTVTCDARALITFRTSALQGITDPLGQPKPVVTGSVGQSG